MAKIYNSELIKEIVDGAKIQIASDSIPVELSEKIVPVMEVNPFMLKKCNIVKRASNSTINSSGAIYTTPTDQDFYLCGYELSFINDATSQASSGEILATPREMLSSTFMGTMFNITGTSFAGTMSKDFNRPILLKRGDAITATINGTAVGSAILNAMIYGFTVSNINA